MFTHSSLFPSTPGFSFHAPHSQERSPKHSPSVSTEPGGDQGLEIMRHALKHLVCGLLAVGLGQVTFCSELQFIYKTKEPAKISPCDFLPDFFP